MATQKRRDLQGIRGYAILSVILFHFFPKYFPNGYIGVDQFFVLSGYLIAMVLNQEKSINLESMKEFYYRRIKRIVPMYLLVILLTLIILRFFLPITNFDSNVNSVWSALFFITNLRGDDPDMAYEVLLAVAQDAFAHTWSLAVEMQFYAIVPFIFYILLEVPSKLRSFVFAILISTSCLYQITTADDYTAFNSVFARIWQFAMGIYSFFVTNVEAETHKQNENDCELLLTDEAEVKTEGPLPILDSVVFYAFGALTILAFAPKVLPPVYLRLVVTILTGAVMICGTRVQSMLVSNRLFSYLGDISYSLYLVHWPIYTCIKLLYPSSTTGLFIGIFCSCCLSILLTETYEKIYLKAEKPKILALIFVLYCVCISLLVLSNIDKRNVLSRAREQNMSDYRNWTTDQIIKENSAYTRNDRASQTLQLCKYEDGKGPYSWCEFKNITGSGKNNIMIVGNSYAPNNAPIIYESCRDKAYNMTLYSIPGCEAFLKSAGKKCADWYTKFLDAVKQSRPDVLFMLFRYNLFPATPKNTTDKYVLMMEKRIKEYEALVKKKIFILNALPKSSNYLSSIVNGKLKKKEKILQSSLGKDIAYQPQRDRMKQMVATCPKCELLDYMPPLTVNGTYTFFDEKTGLVYFTNSQHLSPHGLSTVQPVYEKVCDAL